MRAEVRRVLGLPGRWLLCGAAGGLACAALALILGAGDCPPLVLGLAFNGGILGVLSGGVVRATQWFGEKLGRGYGPGALIVTAAGCCLLLAATMAGAVSGGARLSEPYDGWAGSPWPAPCT